MANIRSSNELIMFLLDFFRTRVPEADTKPGSVIRDLMIESQANMQAILYEELSKSSTLSSIRLSIGTDLDRLGQNYGALRKAATKSTGIALLTFNSIPTSIAIDKGSLLFSSNGFSFNVLNGTSVTPTNSNLYKSIATKYKADLDFIGITDTYAIEVSVEASTPGLAGNLAKYSINRTSIPGVSNVTNIFPFSGGSNQEDDATFRSRILAIFSGSNVGTSLGYRNVALSDASVLDALVIEPGDPLMTRDGTQVVKNSDGSFTIISEGSGGKVDILILGSRPSEHIDSYIYHDLSNSNDPTSDNNIIVLGQIASDEGKTITRKRIDDLDNGVLPAQPADNILEVSGSGSGSNFKEKEVDSLGRVSGNYEIIRDTGAFSGSPWGFDKFHWISNKISLFDEDRIKAAFNSQDSLTFTDVENIPQVQQNIQITNENSIVSSSDRSIIQLLHKPATSVTRVFNTNTGERYTIVDQNLDGDDTINITGRIQISGNSLPSTSDILQVDYVWILDYDPYSDYDGKFLNDNLRTPGDNIDWGYGNLIRKEPVTMSLNAEETFFSGKVSHNISSVISANVFSQENSQVEVIIDPLSPLYLKKVINLSLLESAIENIDSIVFQNTNLELYNTAQNDGSFSNTRVAVDSEIKFNAIIVLPSDTIANDLDFVTVKYNTIDIFTVDGNSGNYSGTQITIPVDNFDGYTDSFWTEVSYIASIQDLISAGISNFPISRSGNGFTLKNKSGFTNNQIANIVRHENQIVAQNTDGYYVKTSLSAAEYGLLNTQVLSVIRLSDVLELVDADNPCTITTSSDGYFQIVFNGVNSPHVNDQVLIIFYCDDLKRNQPITFANNIIRTDLNTLSYDSVNEKFFTTIHSFSTSSDIEFEIFDSVTNEILLSGTDGSLTTSFSSSNIAEFSSAEDFDSITNITSKKIRISNNSSRNNNGIFDISAINSIDNKITIKSIFNKVGSNQIEIIRISDGQSLWNADGEIDFDNNELFLPGINVPNIGDKVLIIYYESQNLRQSPSKLLVNVTDQINVSGVLAIAGQSFYKVDEVVFTAINSGLKQNLSEAIRTFLGAASTATLSSNIKIKRLVKLEKVETTSGNEVLSVLHTYDIKGYYLKDNSLYANESFIDDTLSNVEIKLPATSSNEDESPQIGDSLRVTFYYTIDNDKENLFFTRNGTLYTDKTFSLVNSVYVSSGFTKSSSTKITISTMNQPVSGSRYKAFYDYIAPKENERIVIRYNYNKLISDVTLNVETNRPINADVLVKAAVQIPVDVTMNVVISSTQSDVGASQIVVQNLVDKLIAQLNVNKLGTIIDASDLINTAYSVDGVDRARIIYFNKSGELGQVLSLTAQKNEYFIANNVIVNIETR